MKSQFVSFVCITFFTLFFANTCCALNGNWFFSIEPDSIQCVDIILPDDAGYLGRGTFEYRITCEPKEECLSWGSTVTDERVTASENNTGIIPVCFNTIGKPVGNCSLPMLLRVECNELGISKSWEGGVCVSRYRDFESSERKKGETVEDVLNNNFGLFDAGFSQNMIYSLPSETIRYPLFIESYANLTLDIDIISDVLETEPIHSTVSLSKTEPHKSVNITVTVPDKEGRYILHAKITARNCEESYCTKTIHGTIIIDSNINNTEGFSLSLFPDNINIKEPKPVIFKYSLHNYGERKSFDLSLSITPHEGILTTFRNQEIELETNEEISKSFLVTPLNTTSMYEITLSASVRSAKSKGVKRATSWLSVNEMLTDVARQRDAIEDPKTRREFQKDIDKWYETYRNSEYGNDISEYQSLKDALESAKAKPSPQRDNATGTAWPSQEENQGNPFILPLIIIISVIAVVVFLLYKFVLGKSKDELQEEYGYY